MELFFCVANQYALEIARVIRCTRVTMATPNWVTKIMGLKVVEKGKLCTSAKLLTNISEAKSFEMKRKQICETSNLSQCCCVFS